MATLFTKILNKELPGHFVYEDDKCGAFLSIAPLTYGHTLVVPRQEVDHWVDLSDELMSWCFSVAKKIAKAQIKAFNPKKVGLIVAGLEVPHTHIHVIPMQSEQDLDFNKAQTVPQEQLAQAAQELRQALLSM